MSLKEVSQRSTDEITWEEITVPSLHGADESDQRFIASLKQHDEFSQL